MEGLLMKRKYEKPQMAVHHIQPITMIAGSGDILLNNVQSEDEEIIMPGGELLPGYAL